MGEHLLFSEGLTPAPNHAAIAATYLGQAHIAGTGPVGKTCRECVFWHKTKYRKVAEGVFEPVQTPPRLFWQKTHDDALRAQEGFLQSADPEQSGSSHPAPCACLPSIRGLRKPTAHYEGA